MELHEIITKLTGPIQAVGETNSDARRFENLEATLELLDRLIFDVSEAARSANRPEASMAKIGKRAQAFLDDLRDSLENAQGHPARPSESQ